MNFRLNVSKIRHSTNDIWSWNKSWNANWPQLVAWPKWSFSTAQSRKTFGQFARRVSTGALLEPTVAKFNYIFRALKLVFLLKIGIVYGSGSYFAKNFSYSHQYGKKVFQCLVLTGRFCQGSTEMKVAPWFDEEQGVFYDSVVNDVLNPEIFVVFSDNHAYPEYVITVEWRVIYWFEWQFVDFPFQYVLVFYRCVD